MNPSADWQALEKNVCDTLKEWELKIGYGKEPVELYYPAESLCCLLGLPQEQKGRLQEALALFSRNVQERFGEVEITHNQDRYCIRIPESGLKYVRDHVMASPFLIKFLETVQRSESTMASVEQLFWEFSRQVVKQPGEDGALIFFFEDQAVDEYVYCVEEDAFGLQYHRFTRTDYKNLYGKH